MIERDALTGTYGAKTVLDRLTFTVEPGIVTGFLGPNGAGRSTAMRLVLGLEPATSGTARTDLRLHDQKHPVLSMFHPVKEIHDATRTQQCESHPRTAAHGRSRDRRRPRGGRAGRGGRLRA